MKTIPCTGGEGIPYSGPEVPATDTQDARWRPSNQLEDAGLQRAGDVGAPPQAIRLAWPCGSDVSDGRRPSEVLFDDVQGTEREAGDAVTAADWLETTHALLSQTNATELTSSSREA